MLIHCPECSKKISEFAESCPGCGLPMKMVEIERKTIECDCVDGKTRFGTCPACKGAGKRNYKIANFK
jgi:hypothetical protein